MPTITWKKLPSALQIIAEAWRRKAASGYIAPDGFRLILLNTGGTITNSTDLSAVTKEQLLGFEVAQAYGYSAPAIVYSAGSYDTTDKRYEMSAPSVDITASGGSISYDVVGVWANATNNRNKSVTSMTASTDLINVTSHGLSVNDPVMFTGSGTIAGGLSKNIIYYVQSVSDSNNFKVSATSGGSAIDLTADASGSLTLRYATGWPEIVAFPGSQIINDGSTHTFTVSYNHLNTGDITGV